MSTPRSTTTPRVPTRHNTSKHLMLHATQSQGIRPTPALADEQRKPLAPFLKDNMDDFADCTLVSLSSREGTPRQSPIAPSAPHALPNRVDADDGPILLTVAKSYRQKAHYERSQLRKVQSSVSSAASRTAPHVHHVPASVVATPRTLPPRSDVSHASLVPSEERSRALDISEEHVDVTPKKVTPAAQSFYGRTGGYLQRRTKQVALDVDAFEHSTSVRTTSALPTPLSSRSPSTLVAAADYSRIASERTIEAQEAVFLSVGELEGAEERLRSSIELRSDGAVSIWASQATVEHKIIIQDALARTASLEMYKRHDLEVEEQKEARELLHSVYAAIGSDISKTESIDRFVSLYRFIVGAQEGVALHIRNQQLRQRSSLQLRETHDAEALDRSAVEQIAQSFFEDTWRAERFFSACIRGLLRTVVTLEQAQFQKLAAGALYDQKCIMARAMWAEETAGSGLSPTRVDLGAIHPEDRSVSPSADISARRLLLRAAILEDEHMHRDCVIERSEHDAFRSIRQRYLLKGDEIATRQGTIVLENRKRLMVVMESLVASYAIIKKLMEQESDAARARLIRLELLAREPFSRSSVSQRLLVESQGELNDYSRQWLIEEELIGRGTVSNDLTATCLDLVHNFSLTATSLVAHAPTGRLAMRMWYCTRRCTERLHASLGDWIGTMEVVYGASSMAAACHSWAAAVRAAEEREELENRAALELRVVLEWELAKRRDIEAVCSSSASVICLVFKEQVRRTHLVETVIRSDLQLYQLQAVSGRESLQRAMLCESQQTQRFAGCYAPLYCALEAAGRSSIAAVESAAFHQNIAPQIEDEKEQWTVASRALRQIHRVVISDEHLHRRKLLTDFCVGLKVLLVADFHEEEHFDRWEYFMPWELEEREEIARETLMALRLSIMFMLSASAIVSAQEAGSRTIAVAEGNERGSIAAAQASMYRRIFLSQVFDFESARMSLMECQERTRRIVLPFCEGKETVLRRALGSEAQSSTVPDCLLPELVQRERLVRIESEKTWYRSQVQHKEVFVRQHMLVEYQALRSSIVRNLLCGALSLAEARDRRYVEHEHHKSLWFGPISRRRLLDEATVEKKELFVCFVLHIIDERLEQLCTEEQYQRRLIALETDSAMWQDPKDGPLPMQRRISSRKSMRRSSRDSRKLVRLDASTPTMLEVHSEEEDDEGEQEDSIAAAYEDVSRAKTFGTLRRHASLLQMQCDADTLVEEFIFEEGADRFHSLQVPFLTQLEAVTRQVLCDEEDCVAAAHQRNAKHAVGHQIAWEASRDKLYIREIAERQRTQAVEDLSRAAIDTQLSELRGRLFLIHRAQTGVSELSLMEAQMNERLRRRMVMELQRSASTHLLFTQEEEMNRQLLMDKQDHARLGVTLKELCSTALVSAAALVRAQAVEHRRISCLCAEGVARHEVEQQRLLYIATLHCSELVLRETIVRDQLGANGVFGAQVLLLMEAEAEGRLDIKELSSHNGTTLRRTQSSHSLASIDRAEARVRSVLTREEAVSKKLLDVIFEEAQNRLEICGAAFRGKSAIAADEISSNERSHRLSVECCEHRAVDQIQVCCAETIARCSCAATFTLEHRRLIERAMFELESSCIEEEAMRTISELSESSPQRLLDSVFLPICEEEEAALRSDLEVFCLDGMLRLLLSLVARCEETARRTQLAGPCSAAWRALRLSELNSRELSENDSDEVRTRREIQRLSDATWNQLQRSERATHFLHEYVAFQSIHQNIYFRRLQVFTATSAFILRCEAEENEANARAQLSYLACKEAVVVEELEQRRSTAERERQSRLSKIFSAFMNELEALERRNVLLSPEDHHWHHALQTAKIIEEHIDRRAIEGQWLERHTHVRREAAFQCCAQQTLEDEASMRVELRQTEQSDSLRLFLFLVTSEESGHRLCLDSQFVRWSSDAVLQSSLLSVQHSEVNDRIGHAARFWEERVLMVTELESRLRSSLLVGEARRALAAQQHLEALRLFHEESLARHASDSEEPCWRIDILLDEVRSAEDTTRWLHASDYNARMAELCMVGIVADGLEPLHRRTLASALLETLTRLHHWLACEVDLCAAMCDEEPSQRRSIWDSLMETGLGIFMEAIAAEEQLTRSFTQHDCQQDWLLLLVNAHEDLERCVRDAVLSDEGTGYLELLEWEDKSFHQAQLEQALREELEHSTQEVLELDRGNHDLMESLKDRMVAFQELEALHEEEHTVVRAFKRAQREKRRAEKVLRDFGDATRAAALVAYAEEDSETTQVVQRLWVTSAPSPGPNFDTATPIDGSDQRRAETISVSPRGSAALDQVPLARPLFPSTVRAASVDPALVAVLGPLPSLPRYKFDAANVEARARRVLERLEHVDRNVDQIDRSKHTTMESVRASACTFQQKLFESIARELDVLEGKFLQLRGVEDEVIHHVYRGTGTSSNPRPRAAVDAYHAELAAEAASLLSEQTADEAAAEVASLADKTIRLEKEIDAIRHEIAVERMHHASAVREANTNLCGSQEAYTILEADVSEMKVRSSQLRERYLMMLATRNQQRLEAGRLRRATTPPNSSRRTTPTRSAATPRQGSATPRHQTPRTTTPRNAVATPQSTPKPLRASASPLVDRRVPSASPKTPKRNIWK